MACDKSVRSVRELRPATCHCKPAEAVILMQIPLMPLPLPLPSSKKPVDILIIGLGFVGTYIRSLCASSDIPCAATTTTGRDSTIEFKFVPDLDCAAYKVLPESTFIVITFPWTTTDSPEKFIKCYKETHASVPNLVLLGSTGCFKDDTLWHDRHGTIQSDNRILVENKLLKLGGCVLNLAGLWGGWLKFGLAVYSSV
jgi:hypothetical protein